MKYFVGTLAAIATLSAVSATAQSLPENMYIDGYIEISHYHSTGNFSTSNDTFRRASINLGLIPTRNDGLGIGFSLGVDKRYSDDIIRLGYAAIYPAVTFALGDSGLLSVGVPRPILDYGYIPTDTLAHASGLEETLNPWGFQRSPTARLYTYSRRKTTLYGLRYDGTFGNTKIGAAYHHTTTTKGEFDALSLAFQHKIDAPATMPQIMAFGGFEHRYYQYAGGHREDNTYILGLEASSNKLRAGVIATKNDGATLKRIVNLYADYKISDSFSVSASVLNNNFQSTEFVTDYSVGAEYKILNGGYVNASYTKRDGRRPDDLIDVSFGWRF